MKKMNKEKVMELLSAYAEKHPLSVECGSEYIMQDDKAQVDALELVCNIFDSIEELGEEEQNDGWIPVEKKLPEPGNYILLSFGNFPVPQVGRWEENDYAGAFYLGDEEETCVSQLLFVNAWQPLPEPYRESEKE